MEPVLNVITVLIFLGVAQALFLGFFFFTGGRGATLSNRYLGLFLLALGAIILEMMLSYSGYIVRVIHLVDFSEPVNFLVGPLLYLSVRARITPNAPFRRRQLWHFVPFVLYALYHIPYMMQSAEFKEVAWSQAWRGTEGGPSITPTMNIDILGIRSVVTELTVVHIALYTAAAWRSLVGAFRGRGLHWWGRGGDELVWLRTFLLQFSLVCLSVAVVKLWFHHDLGDYLIALFITIVIYTTSASVIGRSSVLMSSPRRTVRKYERSALAPERVDAVLARLTQVMAEEKPYLESSLTLGDLAAAVKVSPHHLSQVLNDAVGTSFHHYLAQHRIDEAKRLLAGPDRDRLRIEDIAERVGYSSKSSFNTAFRRLVGVTPSQYRTSQES